MTNNELVSEALKDVKVKIILFIRDPIEFMVSAYGQSIKRRGQIDSIDDASKRFGNVRNVDRFINFCINQNYDLEIANYSKLKNDLPSVFEEALNIPLGTLELPAIKNINRSLTASELELQRLFNLYFGGRSSRFISDVLCNELPDIRPEKISLGDKVTSEFLSQISKDVERVNRKLDVECRYSLSVDDFVSDQHTGDSFTFTREQLEVLVKSICAQLGDGDSRP